MIIIAHRLSTIRNANNIVVLGKKGEIIEQGDYNTLMEKKGKYFSLVDKDSSQKDSNQNENEQSINDSKNTDEPDKGENALMTVTGRNNTNENKALVENIELDFTEVTDKNKEKNKNKSTIKRFLKAVNPNKWYFIFGCAFSFISGIFHPYVATLLGEGIDKLNGTNPNEIKREGRYYALIFISVTVAATIIEYIRTFCFDYLGEKISVDFKKRIFATFLRLHPGFYDEKNNTPGNLVSQMTIKTDAINGVVLTLFSMIIQAIGNLASSIIFGFVYDYKITLINICFVPLMLFINYLMIVTNSKEEQRKLNSKYGEVLSENLGNILTISSFNAYHKSHEAVVNAVYDGSEDDFKYSSLGGLLYGLNLSLISITLLFTFFGAGKFYIKGNLTLTNFLKSFNAISAGLFFIGMALKYIKDINLMKEAINGLFEQTEIKSEIDPEETTKTLIKAEKSIFKAKIEFRKVTFAYPTNLKQPILKNVSFVINPGEKVGFLGSSGAGKSTITQLIERFYDPIEGEILIDDINIKQYDIKSLRKVMSFVQQEPNLFSRSTLENIRYGNLEASDETIKLVAEKCKIEHKLNTQISDKKDLMANNDVLSGGETQRVAIARALIHEPKLLLLDEATSALDNKTEDEIQSMLDTIISGEQMTVIVIAHRLRAVKECDKCFLMQKGKIIKTGTLEEVMKEYK